MKELELLKQARDWIDGNGRYDKAKQLVKDIDEALANHIPDAENMVAQPEHKKYCSVCQGCGQVDTGIMESPVTICNSCNGTGLVAQPEQKPVTHTLNCVCGAVWDIKANGSEEMVHTPDINPPQRKPLMDEQMQFLATAIGQAQQIIDTHNAEFVTARDDLRRCAELLAAHGIKE